VSFKATSTTTPFPGNIVSLRSFRLEVSKRWLRVLHCRSQKAGSRGSALRVSWSNGFRRSAFFTRIPTYASTPSICGRSRMR